MPWINPRRLRPASKRSPPTLIIPRLNYQLGRAYGYSGRGEEAMPYRLKALEADYPQSLFVIGYLYSIGRTIEPDICKTYELWQRAARYRRLAALVALPATQSCAETLRRAARLFRLRVCGLI